MSPRKEKKGKREKVESENEEELGSDDYRRKRDRNNEAVKRSRVKSKQKTQETLSRVNKLKNENQILEERVKTLTKELSFLKELFLLHASSKGSPPKSEELQKILSDEPSTSS